MLKLEALRKLDRATSHTLERLVLASLRSDKERKPNPLMNILKKGMEHRLEKRDLLEPKKLTMFSDMSYGDRKKRLDSASETRHDAGSEARDTKSGLSFSILAVPHEKGPTTMNTSYESSKSSRVQGKKDKSGVLALGDILSLMVKDQSEEKAEVKVVTGDGIANVEMECAPKSFFDTMGEQARFRQCLFKVETASQYGFQTRVKGLKELVEEELDPAVIPTLSRLAEDEAEANSTEAWEVLGKAVAYGDRIQLRHLQSDSYVTISEEIAREPGCLKVVLDKDGNEGSWLLVLPCNKLQKEGEIVRYSDPFILHVSLNKSDYYLHLAKKVGKGPENMRELNGSILPSHWQARKFISHAELKKNPEFVSTGDSFRIIVKQNEGYLTVTSPALAAILPPKIVLSDKVEIRKQESKEVKMDPVLYVDFDKTSLNVWELERKRVSIGGIAQEHELFRLKNVATGLFLAVEFEKSVVMTKDGNKETVLFRFITEDATGGPLKFKTLLRFQHYKSKRFIQAKEESGEMRGLFGEGEERMPIVFTVSLDSRNSLSQFFVFEDEAEDNTVHIHQVSLVLPKIVSFYRFLQEWGLIQRKGVYFPDFEVARSTESDLEANSKHLTQILANVTRRVLKDEEFGLKLRQQSILESNLLLVLLKLAELLHEKSKVPITPQPQKKGEGEENIPQLLAKGHIQPLARQLYITLLSAIKNNPECCQVVYSNAAFLATQLSDYKVEVGKLLKETFKHAAKVEHSVRQEELSTWLGQIQPLDEVSDNILGQTVILKIMCSLCLANSQALPKFQNIIDDGLASRKGKLCKFRMYSGEPCFELDTGHGSLDRFLEANPVLKTLGKKVEDDHNLVAVFFLASVTPHKFLVNYLVAVLNVLIHISYSRNSKAATQVIKDYNISFDFAFTCMKDARISLKLRERFSHFCRTIFLDRDPLMQMTDRQHSCFIWDAQKSQISESYEDTSDIDMFPFLRQSEAVVVRVTELVQWLETVWVSPEYPYRNGLLSDKIHFVTELLRLSKLILDLGYTSYEFFLNIHESILRLICLESRDERHWCDHLSQELKQEDQGEGTVDLLETALEVLQLGCELRKARQVTAFCNTFATLKDLDDVSAQEEMLQSEVFRSSEFSTRGKEADFSVDVKRQRSFKKVLPDFKPISKPVHFDQVVMQLFLRSPSKRLVSAVLPTILSSFYQREKLKSSLSQTVLYEKQETAIMFRKMQAIHGRLFVLIREIKFGSGVSKHHLEKTASNEMNELLITLRLICIEIKKLLRLHQAREDLEVAQMTARNLGVTKLLFGFLEEDYPWIVRGESGTVVLPSWTTDIYKEVISCLYLNCYSHSDIRQFAYDHINVIIKYLGNDIRGSKLMQESIASQRASSVAARVIDYILGMLNSAPEPRNRPGDLSILLNLVMDETGKVHKKNQEIVFKGIMQSENIMKMYEDEGNVNLVLFKQDTDMFIRFHGAFIRLLGMCALDNRVVMLHCQRLLPFYIIFREISKENLNYYVKREYLMFIFRVYAVELTDGTKRGLPLNEFHELLNSVVIPDLELYAKHKENLLEISRKNMFASVYCPLASDFAFNSARAMLESRRKSLASMLIPKSQQQTHSEEEFDLTSLSKDQHDSLQYWKYCTNYKPWGPKQASGLLQFVEALSRELSSHNHPCSPELFSSLDKLKQVLGDMLDTAMALAKMHDDLEFTCLISQLNDTIQEIPNYILDDAIQETELMEQKAFQELLMEIKLYLERSHLSLAVFFKNLHPEPTITKKQLLLKLKSILESHISAHSLLQALNFMDPQLQQTYDIMAFQSEMKKFLHRSAYIVRKMKKEDEEAKEETVQIQVLSEMQLFLKARYDAVSGIGEESDDLAVCLRNIISELDAESETFRIVLAPSEDPGPQLLLLKALVNVAIDERPGALVMNKVREWLRSAGTIELVLSLAHISIVPELSEHCFQYLNAMLESDMSNVLPRTMKKLTEVSFPFLSFCQSELRSVKAWLQQQTQEKALTTKLTFQPATEFETVDQAAGLKSYSVALQMLKFVQLCCRTCDRAYQNLFRVQGSGAGSINLVEEIALFLIYLRNIPDVKDRINESEAWHICLALLETLIDLMAGVCVENQREIGSKRALYQFINWVMEDHLTYTDEEDRRHSIVISTIRLLRALVQGSKLPFVADIIIEEINASDLVRVSESVYRQLVAARTKKVLQDSAGHGRVGWECLELAGDEVTQKQREIISMAFDIRILMKRLNSLSSVEIEISKETSQEDELSALKLKKFDQHFYTSFHTNQFSESVPKNLLTLSPLKQVQYAVTHSLSQEQEQPEQLFFEAFISSVDVNYRGELVRLFFRIPVVCSHAPRFMRRHLVKSISIPKHQDKLKKFIAVSETFELEMKHRQELARYPIFVKIFKRWRAYYRLCFFLIVVINGMLLFSMEHRSGSTGNAASPTGVDYTIYVMGGFQVFFAALVFISSTAMYYPVTVTKRLQEAEARLRRKLKEPMSTAGHRLSVELHSRAAERSVRPKVSLTYLLSSILLDTGCQYNCVYLTLSVLSLLYWYLYPVLLLDLVKRVNTLSRMLHRVWVNIRLIAWLTLLMLVIVYGFSIVAFLQLSDYFTTEDPGHGGLAHCDSLWACALSTLLMGVPAQGGIGAVTVQADTGDRLYVNKLIFNVCFFLLVSVLFFCLVFGIVVDSLAQARDHLTAKIANSRRCFICGSPMDVLEANRINWQNHVFCEHNIHSYLFFLVYIRNKPLQQCRGVERYVKEELESGGIAFFPVPSQVMEGRD